MPLNILHLLDLAPPFNTVAYSYEAGGSLSVSGTSVESVADEVTMPFRWKVYETDFFTQDFTWAVGERPFSFYRVVGTCKPAGCPPVSAPDCGSNSKFNITVNIYARNLAEVCQKLQERFITFPIQSIQRFTRPAAISDFTSTTDTTCNVLEDVTPGPNDQFCSDLLTDVAPLFTFGLGMRVFPTILEYEGGGSLGLSGTGIFTGFPPYPGRGGAVLTGQATVAQANYNYLYEASGALGLSGEVSLTKSFWDYTGSGSLFLTGLARWAASAIHFEGGGVLQFHGTCGLLLENGGGGHASFGGSAGVVWSANYQPSGGLAFSGSADVTSSLYVGAGGTALSGSAGVTSSEQGVKVFNLGGGFTVQAQGVEFAFDGNATTLTPTVTIIQTKCCPLSLPQRLRITQQLGTSNYFSRFLQRNNLTFASSQDLYYNFSEVAWYNTLHFQGFAPDFPTIEQWTLTFGFQCVNNDELNVLPVSGVYWKFTFLATLRSFNNSNIPQRVTRLIAGFDANNVCFNATPLSFSFDINTQTGGTVPSAVQTLVYVDDIGLFKSPSFLVNPTITFKISELAVDIPPVVIDIGPAVASAAQIGSGVTGNKPPTIPVG